MPKTAGHTVNDGAAQLLAGDRHDFRHDLRLRLNVDMKASPQTTLSIGQAADHAGVAAHVLRHWEATGLLAPARTRTGERRYSPDDLYRIALIVKAKKAGFSLDDIGEMFTTRDPTDRQAMLRQQRADLKRRIAELESCLHLVETVLGCRHEDFARCPTFRAAVVAEQP